MLISKSVAASLPRVTTFLSLKHHPASSSSSFGLDYAKINVLQCVPQVASPPHCTSNKDRYQNSIDIIVMRNNSPMTSKNTFLKSLFIFLKEYLYSIINIRVFSSPMYVGINLH